MPLQLVTPAALSDHMDRDVTGKKKKTNFADKEVGFIRVVFHLWVSTGPGVK